MKEILSKRGFTDAEITKLESQEDYETVRLKVERMQADTLMDQLQTRTESQVETTSQTLEKRWERFKQDISSIEASGDEVGDNTPETLEEMRTRLETEARTQVENTITEKVGSIPLIGEGLANWLISMTKDIGKDNNSMGGKVKHWFAMLVAGFFGVKGLMNGLEGNIDAARSAVVKNTPTIPNIEVTDEDKDTLIYESGLSLILILSEDDDNNENIRSIFNQKSVKESSYTELLSPQLSVEGFLGDDVRLTQNTLQSQEGLIDSILGKDNPNWKDMKLIEIFKEIGKYGDIFSQLESISPEEILSGTASFGNISFSGGIISGSLGRLFEENVSNPESLLHGVNKGLFLQLFRDNTKKITNPTVLSGLRGDTYDSEQDIKFEEDFVGFGTNFVNTISNNFFLGNPEYKTKFQEYFNTRSLSLKEVLEFYIITGGERDTNNYNDAVRTIIYTKIWGILGEEDGYNELRVNTYNNAIKTIIEGGIVEGQEHIPPQLIIIGRRILKGGVGIIERTIYQTGDGIAEMWGTLDEKTQIAIVIGGGVGLILLLRSRLFLAKASGIGIGLQISIIFALITMSKSAFADEGFRERHPGIKSQEEILNNALIELGQKGISLNEGVISMQSSNSSIGTQGLDFSKLDGSIEVLEGNSTPEENIRPNYRSYTVYRDILEQDGMEIIPLEGDIIEENYGSLTVRKNRITLDVSFLVNNVERNVYFKSGPSGQVAKNILGNISFVKDSSGKTFLAFPLGSIGKNYHYVSLNELEERISNSEKGEYLVAEDIYLYWDLFMDGNSPT